MQSDDAMHPDPAMLDALVTAAARVAVAAGMPQPATPAPPDALPWLLERLRQLHRHLTPPPLDALDALDGLGDARVYSDDEIDRVCDDAPPRRRTSAKRARSSGAICIPPYLPQHLPALPINDDAPLLSAHNSGLDSRPMSRFSHLAKLSSLKSMGYSKANKLHRDYSKLFLDQEKSKLDSGESSIKVAAGDLYDTNPLSERWELCDKIGEGGYSIVRLARRKDPLPGQPPPEHRLAAIKVISKRKPDRYNEKMVSREVFCFRLLELAGGHGNIVELYEVCEDDDNVYLIMEFLKGGELFYRISERGQYTERDAANLVVSMLASLAFCHRHNLTHRDVKPENFVFMEPNGDDADVKLTDFGIAYYSEDPSALCKTLCGTPLYVAPEVLLRQPYGPEADVWSVGVIIYIMLVGYPPFDDNDIVQLVKKIKYRPVSFDGPQWKLISPEGQEFVANLLDKDASNRMNAQQALEHDWLRNNCQAATMNVLDIAQENIRSFGNRRAWHTAIQGVTVMNRLHRMMQDDSNANIGDEMDDISARQAEAFTPQSGQNGENYSLDFIHGSSLSRRISSSSSEQESIETRTTPIGYMIESSSSAQPASLSSSDHAPNHQSSFVRSHASHRLPLPTVPEIEHGSSSALPSLDTTLGGSAKFIRFSNERPRPQRQNGPPSLQYAPPLARMESSPVPNRVFNDSSGRLGRSLTRGDGGVVRKMSSRARRLVAWRRRGKPDNLQDDGRPVMIGIGEHRRHRLPWLR